MSDKKSETESVELTTPVSTQPVLWTDDHENILVEWADKALCYKWLHSKSHINYSRANAWYTIPVIILSTLTGTANFAQERFGDDIKPYIAMVVGALNIFAGILTTISQYLKIGELNEAHRVSSISWDKFYRNIKVELAKAPSERIEVLQMLKISKEEFDRLMETSPAVAEKVTASFKNTFEATNSPTTKYLCCRSNTKISELDKVTQQAKLDAYNSLKKPEICGTLESTRNAVYKRKEPLSETELTNSAISLATRSIKMRERQSKIETFIETYKKAKGHAPTEEEIRDEMIGVGMNHSEEKETNPKDDSDQNNIEIDISDAKQI